MPNRNLRSRYDVVIVGSGIAGMLLAVELDRKGMRAALVCKGRLMDSNTSWAQGGVAIYTGLNPADSREQHLEDTLAAGAGLCAPKMAEKIIDGGVALFEKLESLGLEFDRDGDTLSLAREGGHSQARVLHNRDASGKAISETLIKAIHASKKLAVFEQMFAVDLLMHGNQCIGLRVLKDNKTVEILAPRVVLASGGLGQVFERTSNPSIATGDGIAMAYRAGAELVDMEFVQFHPTALYLPGAPASLISEAVRGDGAHLLDSRNDRFTFRYHKNGELATRDIVSRAIVATMNEQSLSNVWLDMRPLGASKILEKYPNIVAACRNWKIDPLEKPIPVSPAAHYFMGGIWTDENGRTSMPGLYAIGECASNGLHGANRLASNSLLEGGVMAMRTARAILSEQAATMPFNKLAIEETLLLASEACTVETLDEFRKKMFAHVGLLRDGKPLAELVMEQFRGPHHQVPFEQESIEAANIGLLGRLIARSAMVRCESRGAHWRIDYPQTDDIRFSGRYFVSVESSEFRPLTPAKFPLTIVPASTVSALLS